MKRLVDRFGRTGFAALTSLFWALPMAAWAGSADLSPIDHTAYPWVALTAGAVMLVAWLVLVARLGRVPVSKREHRLDLQRMSPAEKRWMLGLAAFITCAIAWLNAAATVDWTPLLDSVRAGRTGPTVFAAALVLFLAGTVAGAVLSWRRATAAFRARVASSLSNAS